MWRSLIVVPLRIAFIIFILILFIAGVVIWWLDPFEWDRTSDENLIALFQKHEAEFNQLNSLAFEDIGKLALVRRDKLGCPETDGRSAEYCRLIDDVHDPVAVGIDHLRISYIYDEGGLGPIGEEWAKGIAYLPHGPDRVGLVEDSLDKERREDGVYLRRIKGDWYILYEHLD